MCREVLLFAVSRVQTGRHLYLMFGAANVEDRRMCMLCLKNDLLPRRLLQWRATDAQIKVLSAKNPKLSEVLPLDPEGGQSKF